MTATPAIDAVGLVKTFGGLRAVDGVDLDVRQGESSGSSALTAQEKRQH